MKKLFGILLLIVFVFSCGKEKESAESKETSRNYTIGISQIVSHPALDAAKEGFKDAFKEAGIEVSYVDTNANGDMSAMELNSKKLVAQNVDLIYAIATPSAQSAQNATNTIPIVFSAVTDAKSAKLDAKNVTGMLDAVDLEKQLDLLLSVDPNVKKLGFIYNSSEQNSIYQLEELKKIAKNKNIEVVEKSASQISEIPQVIESLIQSSDAIYTPADNLVASSIQLIAEKAIAAKKITIGAEKAHVDGGILMTLGIDYYSLGKEAGKMAISILKDGKNPSDIPISKMDNLKQEVNENTKKALGLEF